MFELEDRFFCTIMKTTKRIVTRFNSNSTSKSRPDINKVAILRALAIYFESETVLLPSLMCMIDGELGALSDCGSDNCANSMQKYSQS